MQCEAVTRLVKQGALGGGGGREGGREGGGGGEELERLLRGMCGVTLVVGEEGEGAREEGKEEDEQQQQQQEGDSSGDETVKKRRRTGGREGGRTRRRRRKIQTCEWTDLTLPLLTAIVAQRPMLSAETVLMLLERMLGALEVGEEEGGREGGREGEREGGAWPAGRKERGQKRGM